MKAVLIISHGSRSSKTKQEVFVLINQLKMKTSIALIECAFLELESPLIPEGIELCISKGATEVIVLLNFLNSGRHVDVDIPAIIDQAQKNFPKVKITITQPVGQHAGIVNVFATMLEPFSETS